MAELPVTNITTELINTTLGVMSHQVTDLNNQPTINKWSFYRAGGIQKNVSTEEVELVTDTTPWQFGDYRRYNHTASEPTLDTTATQELTYTGTGVKEVGVMVSFWELNMKELSASDPYLALVFYESEADRTNDVNRYHSEFYVIPMSAEVPPTGHENDQTSRPTSSTQLMLTDVPTLSLDKPFDTLYSEVYISNQFDTETIARFGTTWQTTHEMTQLSNPRIYAGTFLSNSDPKAPPLGSTAMFMQLYPLARAAGDPCPNNPVSSIYEQTLFSSTYDCYMAMHVVEGSGNNPKIMAMGRIVIRGDIGGDDFLVYDGPLTNTQIKTLSGTLPASRTWQSNDQLTLYVDYGTPVDDPLKWQTGAIRECT